MSLFSKKKSDKHLHLRAQRARKLSVLSRFKNTFRKRFLKKASKTATLDASVKSPQGLSVRPAKRKLFKIFRINPRIFRIGTTMLASLIGIFVIWGCINLIRLPVFTLKSYSVIGNNIIPKDKINTKLTNYMGQSLFIVNTRLISEKLLEIYPNLQSVSIRKVFPDKLFLTFTERDPKLILVNLNGAYLIDGDGNVIEVITQEQINYDQNKLELAQGFTDENSKLIQDVFLADFKMKRNIASLPEAQQNEIIAKEFIYADIPQADRLKVYKTLQNEVKNELNSLIGNIQKEIQNEEYAYLPQITYIDNKKLQKQDKIDKNRLELSLSIEHYFNINSPDVKIKGQIVWRGEMLVEVNLTSEVKVIFGVLKKPSVQLEDYEIMTSYLREKNKRIHEIDLSSSKISVK